MNISLKNKFYVEYTILSNLSIFKIPRIMNFGFSLQYYLKQFL
jgi:hypothetical protein